MTCGRLDRFPGVVVLPGGNAAMGKQQPIAGPLGRLIRKRSAGIWSQESASVRIGRVRFYKRWPRG